MHQHLRFIVATLAPAILLLGAVPLLTKQPFDSSAVQGRGCAGNLQCFGMQSESAENLARTPKDRGVGVRHRGLSSSVDLSEYLPPVGSQGRQGSCVAWSTTYYTKTLHEKVARNWSLDAGSSVDSRCSSGVSRVFSPAWTYNQINGGVDRGSSISRAFQLLVAKGAASCGRMPYDVKNYTRQPDSSAQGEAGGYISDSYTRIPCEDRDAIKAALSKKLPVVGGFQVTSDMYNMGSSGVWDRFTPPVKGGHAMAVIGYDDRKSSDRGHRGAFKFVNSWGTGYGKEGFGWISYDNWLSVCKYTYVLYPKQRGGGGDEPTPEPGPKPEPAGTTVKAPTRVVATQGSFADRIVISWEPGEGASAYEVERAQGDSSFQGIGNATDTSFTDSGVQVGVAFRYRIVSIAESARSSGDDSPVAEGYAQQATATRPGSVTGFAAEAETAGKGAVINLSWSEVAGASSYALLRHDSNSRRWTTLTTRATGRSYSDRGAPTGAVVHYAIRAQNSAGAGEYAMVEVKVGGGSRPPGVVTGLSASRGSRRDGIELNWESTPGASGYFLLRYDPSEPEWKVLGRTPNHRHLDSDAGAVSGRQIYYSVVPYSAAGAGKHAEPVMGYAETGAHRGVSPAAPEGLRAASKGRSVTLSWKASKGASEYYVFRKKEQASRYEFVASTGTKLSYSDALPASDTLYFYTVTAKSALGGESAKATAVAAVHNEPKPAVRRRFVPGQGISHLAGTWKATHLGATAAYNLELQVSAGGPGFLAKLSGDGKTRGTASGKYAMDSKSLNANGFSMNLVGENSAVVKIEDRRLFPESLRLVFVRGDR